MSLAQPEVIDSCAHWIGAHALSLLVVIFLAALGVISQHSGTCSKRTDWNFGRIQTPGADASLSGLSRRGFGNVTHVCGGFCGVWFASDSYLGLHLTIGLVGTLAATVGFGALADAVADREDISSATWPQLRCRDDVAGDLCVRLQVGIRSISSARSW